MSDPAPILQAKQLTKSYPSGTTRLEVLCGIDLELQAGEVCALRGASGSGKSTLLHLLGLLDSPDSGELYLDGSPTTHLGSTATAKLRTEKLGFVFQQFQLLPELSALENVLLPRRLFHGFSWWAHRAREKKAAMDELTAVGLKDRSGHRPHQLSGGEQQRVAVARALIGRPTVVLADEPTGNLDRDTGDEVLHLLLDLARTHQTCVLLATHDEKIATRCDRSLHLRKGGFFTPTTP